MNKIKKLVSLGWSPWYVRTAFVAISFLAVAPLTASAQSDIYSGGQPGMKPPIGDFYASSHHDTRIIEDRPINRDFREAPVPPPAPIEIPQKNAGTPARKPVMLQSKGYAGPHFFPAAFDRSRNDWYSQHLVVLQEPILYDLNCQYPTYRFLLLRTWRHPISIRVSFFLDNHAHLSAKESDGAGGYFAGKLILNKEKLLSDQDAKEVLKQIDVMQFWTMPTDDKVGGEDGSQWVIEGREQNKYHVVDRWSPDSGPVHEFGLFMIRLAGVDGSEH